MRYQPYVQTVIFKEYYSKIMRTGLRLVPGFLFFRTFRKQPDEFIEVQQNHVFVRKQRDRIIYEMCGGIR